MNKISLHHFASAFVFSAFISSTIAYEMSEVEGDNTQRVFTIPAPNRKSRVTSVTHPP